MPGTDADAHPLARDLRFFIVFIGGMAIDLCAQSVGAKNGSAAVQPSSIPVGGGTVAKLASASSDYFDWPHREATELIDSITLAWAGRINSVASHHFAGKHTGSGGTDNPFDFRTNGSGAPALVRGKNGAGLCIHEGASALTANVRQTVEITQGPLLNATSLMYANGASMSVTVVVAGPANNAAASGQPIRVGRRADGFVQMDGFTEYVAGWARQISAVDLAEFRRAPYAILRPRETPVFHSLGGGGGGFQAAWAARANTVIQGALHA